MKWQFAYSVEKVFSEIPKINYNGFLSDADLESWAWHFVRPWLEARRRTGGTEVDSLDMFENGHFHISGIQAVLDALANNKISPPPFSFHFTKTTFTSKNLVCQKSRQTAPRSNGQCPFAISDATPVLCRAP